MERDQSSKRNRNQRKYTKLNHGATDGDNREEQAQNSALLRKVAQKLW